MNTKRLRFVLFAIPLVAVAALTVAADRSHAAGGAVIDPSCTSSLPCIAYVNNGTGPGVRGVSLSGNGISGWTKSNSTSAANATFGVVGNDLSVSGIFDSGVRGSSARGTGVSGLSTSGPGISGRSSSGDGVDGSGNTGVLGSGLNIGVLGSSSNTAVQGNSSGAAGIAVLGQSSSSGYGGFFTSNNGDAVKVIGHYRGLDAFGGKAGGFPAIAATANSSGVDLIDGYNTGSVRVAELDDSGNLHLAGKVFTSGSCSAGCISVKTANGGELTAYAAAQTVPSVEDFGKGEIVNGQGHVSIASDFGRVIDPRTEYLVFLTPNGDNRGLYVTGKSMNGFTVRESQGGHASVSFDYRIVARPYASREARLPLWSAKSWETNAPTAR